MARDFELKEALKLAAERFTGRTLSQADVDRLVGFFNQSQGTTYERAKKAVELFVGLGGRQLIENTAAADNLNRILRDLKQVADSWKPTS
jgi:hypothetical protein